MRIAPPSRPRAGRPVVRFKVAPEKIRFDDLIRGEVEFDNALLGDFVIVRADGVPLYHFVVVVDDEAMEITHVIRGEDHLSNTPEAHRPHPRPRLPRAAVRAHPAHPQPRPLEDEQAQEPDGDHRLPRAGLPARGDGQLPRLPRLVAGHRGGDLHPRRARRAVRDREVHKGGADLRPGPPRLPERRLHPRDERRAAGPAPAPVDAGGDRRCATWSRLVPLVKRAAGAAGRRARAARVRVGAGRGGGRLVRARAPPAEEGWSGRGAGRAEARRELLAGLDDADFSAERPRGSGAAPPPRRSG